MSEEIWKPVVGYEGLYEVSDRGRVRTLIKKTRCKSAGGILAQQSAPNRYRLVCLTKDGDDHSRSVHRLVATAFIQNLEGKPTVNHRNGIRDDNRLSNLEWATHAEQQEHARSGGRNWAVRGTARKSAKLTESRVLLLRAMYASGSFSQSEIGAMFGVHQMIVSRIVRMISWSHVPAA